MAGSLFLSAILTVWAVNVAKKDSSKPSDMKMSA
jgi:hypothetical protein